MKKPYVKPKLTYHGELVSKTQFGGSCVKGPPYGNAYGNPNKPWLDDDCDDYKVMVMKWKT